MLSGPGTTGASAQITFRDYVEEEWLPSKHLEVTTRAAYNSYLDKQFYPASAAALSADPPSVVQEWVTKANAEGLSPRSVQEVSRHAALDLSSSGSRPDPRLQPVRAHGAAEGRAARVEDFNA